MVKRVPRNSRSTKEKGQETVQIAKDYGCSKILQMRVFSGRVAGNSAIGGSLAALILGLRPLGLQSGDIRPP